MSLVVVAPVERIPDEFGARQWPLHVTVTTNFETSLAADAVIARIQGAALPAPFTAARGSQTLFGLDGDIPVTLIDPPDEFARLHRSLVDALDPVATWVTPQFLRENYSPHCTSMGGRQMASDVLIDELVLIDNAPDGDPSRRRVLARFPLA
jgi:hypothetical protein